MPHSAEDTANAYTLHALRLMQLEAGSRREVLRLLQELQRDLVAQLSRRKMTDLREESVRKLLKQVNDTIFQYYRDIKASADGVLMGAVEIEAQFTAKTIAESVDFVLETSLPSLTALSAIANKSPVLGAPSSDWWKRQAGNMQFEFTRRLRMGISAGDTNEQILRRMRGTFGGETSSVFDRSSAGARALVHTSIQKSANDARLATFRENSDIIKGVKQLSTLDGRTSQVCVAYSEAQWDLEGKPINGNKLAFNGGPPRHWNCRSVLVPINRTLRELGLDIDQPNKRYRASVDGPIDASVTFEQFLNNKSADFQNDLLGKQKAEWWRKGKLKLNQLVDQTGNPLTVEQLKKKYGFK